MSVKSYTRLELAENQLKTAIGLFIDGHDRFSVITLAGAAEVILSRLVMNSGQETFTESLMRETIEKSQQPVKLGEFGRGINDLLLINQLKHMDEDDSEFIDIDDLGECALAAIMKALANYHSIEDHKKEIVQAFRVWSRLNLDSKRYNIEGNPNWKPQGS